VSGLYRYARSSEKLTSHQSRVAVTGPHTPVFCSHGATLLVRFIVSSLPLMSTCWNKRERRKEEEQLRKDISDDLKALYLYRCSVRVVECPSPRAEVTQDASVNDNDKISELLGSTLAFLLYLNEDSLRTLYPLLT